MPKIHLSQENYDFITKLAGTMQASDGGSVTPDKAFTRMKDGYMQFLMGFSVPDKKEA